MKLASGSIKLHKRIIYSHNAVQIAKAMGLAMGCSECCLYRFRMHLEDSQGKEKKKKKESHIWKLLNTKYHLWLRKSLSCKSLEAILLRESISL